MAGAMQLDTLNPASIHTEGRAAYGALDTARRQVAHSIGLSNPHDLVFTSSGTEANNAAVHALEVQAIIASPIEHASIIETVRAQSTPVYRGRVNAQGVIDLEHLETCMQAAPKPFLCALMWANNETGVLQPIEQVAQLTHQYGGFFLCDAVQVLGKMPIAFDQLDIDLLTLSAHKIGGPTGVGAFVFKKGLPSMRPLICGGTQEMGLRAGTHNLLDIIGFGQACVDIDTQALSWQASMRDYLEEGLLAVDERTIIFSREVPRISNTTCFALESLDAQGALIGLDMRGVSVSLARSACAARAIEARPSHVLLAMGFSPELALRGLRVSMGPSTEKYDIDTFLETWKKVHRQHCLSV